MSLIQFFRMMGHSHSGPRIDSSWNDHSTGGAIMMRTYTFCSPSPRPIKVGIDRPDMSRSKLQSSSYPMIFKCNRQNSGLGNAMCVVVL